MLRAIAWAAFHNNEATLRQLFRFALAATAATLFGGANAAPVLANNPNGDAFTNPSSANLGQAIGTSGWYYNNVRANGTAGIDGTYARSGNGSLHFSGPANAKADVEFLPNAIPFLGNYNSAASLGSFSAFVGMSYEWYRNSTSTTDVRQMPALRVLIDRDGDLTTTNDRGGLVFERVYNEGADQSAAPTNAWTSETIGASTFVWNFGLNLLIGTDSTEDDVSDRVFLRVPVDSLNHGDVILTAGFDGN